MGPKPWAPTESVSCALRSVWALRGQRSNVLGRSRIPYRPLTPSGRSCSRPPFLVVKPLLITTGVTLVTPRQLRFQILCVIAPVLTNVPLSSMFVPQLGASRPEIASANTAVALQLMPDFNVANRERCARLAKTPHLWEDPTDG